MISSKLAKRRGESSEQQGIVVRGIDRALAALKEVRRIQLLKLETADRASRIEHLIEKLRQEGSEAHLPLLLGLAEALEDALILATVDQQLPAP